MWLPSGGSLVIDRTEAMTVVDVNTGKFTGSGGNLEETVTKNNLEAAEEIVRQLRLRDIGGIIVIDFIDMVLETNRDLVLRRLVECLGRDRTRHQVAEVTSLGLVQMTRKRIGTGLLEAFSETCEHCKGRGVIIAASSRSSRRTTRRAGGGGGGCAAAGAARGGRPARPRPAAGDGDGVRRATPERGDDRGAPPRTRRRDVDAADEPAPDAGRLPSEPRGPRPAASRRAAEPSRPTKAAREPSDADAGRARGDRPSPSRARAEPRVEPSPDRLERPPAPSEPTSAPARVTPRGRRRRRAVPATPARSERRPSRPP